MLERLVIPRADGDAITVSGYLRPKAQLPARTYAARRFAPGSLPPRVDLRPNMTPVEQQRDTESCTANAVAGAYEYLVMRHGGERFDASRLFVYYNARRLRGMRPLRDGGCAVADAIRALCRFGACPEALWPFDPGAVNRRPTRAAFEAARAVLVEDMARVPTTLHAWRHALAEGYPIVFGLHLYPSFDRHRTRGRVPMPTRAERRGPYGAHAMLCVGYSDRDQRFIVRNSYGRAWGDEGYCYLPYAYVMNRRLNRGDAWVIRRIEQLRLDPSTWGGDESVLGRFEHDLAALTDEEYGAHLDLLGKVPMELRVAIVFLRTAGVDGTLSLAEAEHMARWCAPILAGLDVHLDVSRVLHHAGRHLVDRALYEESVALLGRCLKRPTLRALADALAQAAAADGLSRPESAALRSLRAAWGLLDSPPQDGATHSALDGLARRRRRSPTSTVTDAVSDRARHARGESTMATAKKTTRKAAAKKAAPKKTAKKAAPKKTAKKAAPKTAAKKAAPKRAAPKRAASKKAADPREEVAGRSGSGGG